MPAGIDLFARYDLLWLPVRLRYSSVWLIDVGNPSMFGACLAPCLTPCLTPFVPLPSDFGHSRNPSTRDSFRVKTGLNLRYSGVWLSDVWNSTIFRRVFDSVRFSASRLLASGIQARATLPTEDGIIRLTPPRLFWEVACRSGQKYRYFVFWTLLIKLDHIFNKTDY